MRLLVSVENASEAVEALAGGADIIDAKNPRRGALGMVDAEACASIAAVCRGRVPWSAALGDDDLTAATEARAALWATAGACLVKMGFARRGSYADVAATLHTLRRVVSREAAERCGVVAVAYADAGATGSTSLDVVLHAAVATGVAGILIDTADKAGPSLRALMRDEDIQAVAVTARAAGLFVALAGRLTLAEVAMVGGWDVDVVGVRGAACEGGRLGRVSAARVRRLRAQCVAPRRPWRSLDAARAEALG